MGCEPEHRSRTGSTHRPNLPFLLDRHYHIRARGLFGKINLFFRLGRQHFAVAGTAWSHGGNRQSHDAGKLLEPARLSGHRLLCPALGYCESDACQSDSRLDVAAERPNLPCSHGQSIADQLFRKRGDADWEATPLHRNRLRERQRCREAAVRHLDKRLRPFAADKPLQRVFRSLAAERQ
jgi:hypothetical protein